MYHDINIEYRESESISAEPEVGQAVGGGGGGIEDIWPIPGKEKDSGLTGCQFNPEVEAAVLEGDCEGASHSISSLTLTSLAATIC